MWANILEQRLTRFVFGLLNVGTSSNLTKTLQSKRLWRGIILPRRCAVRVRVTFNSTLLGCIIYQRRERHYSVCFQIRSSYNLRDRRAE